MGRPYHAEVDGVEMVLCASCYMKLLRSGRAKPLKRREPPRRVAQRIPKARSLSIAEYEIVDDYYDRIRTAREERGLSTKELAMKLRISESLLRKIEQGKIKPSIDLAKRMEKLLGIKLLVPTEEPEGPVGSEGEENYPTLGDIVVVRRDED